MRKKEREKNDEPQSGKINQMPLDGMTAGMILNGIGETGKNGLTDICCEDIMTSKLCFRILRMTLCWFCDDKTEKGIFIASSSSSSFSSNCLSINVDVFICLKFPIKTVNGKRTKTNRWMAGKKPEKKTKEKIIANIVICCVKAMSLVEPLTQNSPKWRISYSWGFSARIHRPDKTIYYYFSLLRQTHRHTPVHAHTHTHTDTHWKRWNGNLTTQKMAWWPSFPDSASNSILMVIFVNRWMGSIVDWLISIASLWMWWHVEMTVGNLAWVFHIKSTANWTVLCGGA